MEIPFKLPLRFDRRLSIIDDDGGTVVRDDNFMDNPQIAEALVDLANANAASGMGPTTEISITSEGSDIKGGVLEAGDRLAVLEAIIVSLCWKSNQGPCWCTNTNTIGHDDRCLFIRSELRCKDTEVFQNERVTKKKQEHRGSRPSVSGNEESMTKSHKAMMECARWLVTCMQIGWRKDQLDKLEKIWWDNHDENGKLFPPKPVGEGPAPSPDQRAESAAKKGRGESEE